MHLLLGRPALLGGSLCLLHLKTTSQPDHKNTSARACGALLTLEGSLQIVHLFLGRPALLGGSLCLLESITHSLVRQTNKQSA